MSIIRKFRQFREFHRLRKAARKAPSPATLGALAERYIAIGRLEDAHRVAEGGVKHFPTSERLGAVLTFTKKQRLQSEIQGLRRDLSERPNPGVYGRLAEIYRDLGNLDQALAVCDQCIERFPLNENPYLILGDVRLTRFLQDRIGMDGTEAEKHIRRVVKLNSQNLKAHLLLVQIYYSIGAVDAMREHLKTSIAISPEPKELEEFLRRFEENPESFAVHRPRQAAAAEEDEDDLLDDDEAATIPDLIRSVEVRGHFVYRPEDCPAHRILGLPGGPNTSRLDMQSLKQNLNEIGGRAGVSNAVILDRDGEPLADVSHTDGLTRRQFSDLVTEILRNSEETSRRMDVGTFQWCTVEGAFGGITIAKVKSVSVGVKYGQTVRADRAHEMIEEFAARNLTAQPEVARA